MCFIYLNNQTFSSRVKRILDLFSLNRVLISSINSNHLGRLVWVTLHQHELTFHVIKTININYNILRQIYLNILVCL